MIEGNRDDSRYQREVGIVEGKSFWVRLQRSPETCFVGEAGVCGGQHICQRQQEVAVEGNSR